MMGDSTFHLVITSVTGAVFDGEVVSMTAPATGGVMTVLANHEPFVSTLRSGTITVREGEGEHTFPIEGGVLECSGNRATVLL